MQSAAIVQSQNATIWYS